MSGNIKVRVLMLKGEKGEKGESDYQPAVDALGKRIDNLILSSGTESSAEVIDARNGYDGTTYDTLGTAIRTQVSELKSDIKNATVKDGSITTSKIADKAVTGNKIDFIDKKNLIFTLQQGMLM